MVELDVRVTFDGVAVLHHDPSIESPDSTPTAIADTTYADLLRLKADLTTLEHAIRTVRRRCQVMIEVKPGVQAYQALDIIPGLLKTGWRSSDFIIASFDFKVLRDVQLTMPELTLAVLDRWSGIRAISRARRLHTPYISMNQRWLWLGLIKTLKRTGFMLSVYTINDPAQIKQWRPYLYAVITDRPDLFEKGA